MSDDRKDQRVKVPTLKAKYKSATVDEFIDQYAGDISRGGIFIKTPKPSNIGQLLKLEIQLKDGAPVISAVGRVVWRREQSEGGQPAGMGIKFIKLEPESIPVIERIVERKAPGEGPHFDEPGETTVPIAGETHSEFFGTTNPQAEMPAEQDRTMMRQMSAFLGEALRGAKEEPKPEPAKTPVPKSTMIGMPIISPAQFNKAAEPTKPAAEPTKPAAEPTKPAAEPAKPAAEPAKPAAEPTKNSMPKGTLVGMPPLLPPIEPKDEKPVAESAVDVPPVAAFEDESFAAPTAVTTKEALDKALSDALASGEVEGEPTSVADKSELDRLLAQSASEVESQKDEAQADTPKEEPETQKEEPEPKAETAPEAPPTTAAAMDAAAAAASAANTVETKKEGPASTVPRKEEPNANKSPMGLIVGILVAAGIGAAAYLYLNRDQTPHDNTNTQTVVVDASVAEPAHAEEDVAQESATSPTLASTEDRAAHTQGEDAAAVAEPEVQDSGVDAATTPMTAPHAQSSTPEPSSTPTPAPHPATDAGARPRPRPTLAPTDARTTATTGSSGSTGSSAAENNVPENPF